MIDRFNKFPGDGKNTLVLCLVCTQNTSKTSNLLACVTSQYLSQGISKSKSDKIILSHGILFPNWSMVKPIYELRDGFI